MTISAVVPDIAFAGSSGSGTMGPFSLIKSGTPLVFFANSEVVVLRYDSVTDTTPTLLVEGTDYTLTGGPTAGSITLTSPQTGLLTAERLYVTTVSALAQNLDLVNGGNFSSSNLERRLDVIFQILQQHGREIKSTIRFAMFDTDEIPKTTPLAAVIDKIAYVTGTAASPTVAYLDADVLADLSEFTDEALADIAIVAADLGSADAIGQVAAIADEIEDVAAAIPAITAVEAALPAIQTVADALDDDLVYTKAETDALLDEKEPLRNDIVRLSSFGTDQAAFEAAVAAAKADGLWLDCEHQTVTFTSLLLLSGAGIYKWKNLEYEKLAQSSGDFERTIRIIGEGFEAHRSLTANAAVGDTTITVSGAAGLAIGDILYLMQNTSYVPAYDGISVIRKGEWITISSVNTGTGVITLGSPLQSSYTTANSARAFKFKETCEVWMDNVTARGGGIGEAQGAMRLAYCVVKQWENMQSFDNEYQSFDWQICVDKWNKGTVYSEGSSLDGEGYAMSAGGCFNPQFLSVTGRDARHMFTGGASFEQTMPDATTLAIMGQGYDIRKVDCIDARGDPFDLHVGVRASKVGTVGGNMLPGTGESCLTLQSPDVTIDSYNVTGGDQGVIIQCWGKPSDEPAPYWNLGQGNLGRGGTSTNRALLVENLDATNRRVMHVNLSAFGANFPGLIVLDCEEGGILMHIGHLTGVSRAIHTVDLISSVNGRPRLTIDRNDAIEDSGNASYYLIHADGSAWEGANAGQFGAFCDILSGSPGADNTAYYANDALITIGKSRGAVTAGQTGIGRVLPGTYTPTLTNTTNISSSSANVCSVSQEGSLVTVTGSVSVTPTGTGDILLGISLPIASAFTAITDADGVSVLPSAAGYGSIFADTTNDRVSLSGNVNATGARTWRFTFQYKVI